MTAAMTLVMTAVFGRTFRMTAVAVTAARSVSLIVIVTMM